MGPIWPTSFVRGRCRKVNSKMKLQNACTLSHKPNSLFKFSASRLQHRQQQVKLRSSYIQKQFSLHIPTILPSIRTTPLGTNSIPWFAGSLNSHLITQAQRCVPYGTSLFCMARTCRSSKNSAPAVYRKYQGPEGRRIHRHR